MSEHEAPAATAPPTVEVEPEGPAKSSVVLLHGLGADGHDFEPIVPELALPPSLAARFVFPHAPVRAVTLNGGLRMRAWYDIYGFDRRSPQDEAGVRASAEIAHELVRRERARGIPAERIVLAGFSQGGAIALFAGLRHPERLGGILALSTYLPLPQALDAEAHPANAAAPVFMAHGRHDPLVPLSLAEVSRDALLRHGQPVDFHTYPMPHSVCAEEVADIATWLRKVLGG
ncbi:MAG TPA: alpha/beta fold hydrolase [Vicinamibacteria bacterium]|nr:alpha/beta fold hydrolase [Vicinamibacteria bacterium]